MAFNKKDIAEQIKQMERQGELQSKLNDSALEYAKHMKVIAELQKNITHIQEQINAEKEKEKEYNAEISKLLQGRKKLDKAELKIRKQQISAILEKRAALRNNTALIEAQLKALEKTNDEYVEAASNVSRINLGLKEGLRFLEKTPGLIKKGYGKLKGYGLFEMDKAIRSAGVEMGKMADVGSAFGKDLIKANDQTFSMGVHVKDLAKMQASYSSELGRSVMLSQEGFEAMSEMSKGTILGADGAGQLAAEMDTFNVSATATRDIIEDTTNMSEKMGLNASTVIKGLKNNLKMANKYHFKGGVKGMVKMAAQAAKFKMSMETTAQFADKLFNIEGAVEMAASLNTMGGEWAKLGDPMKLMFQARNDMEGLQTSVIDATAGMADFNKETGEFSFSGLELHRMKELEKITGISAEQMAEMAKSKAKFAKINGQMGFEVGGDPEMKEFIENSAVFNKDTKQFEIKLSGLDKALPIKELTATHKDMMVADAKSLKERAENSQSFDEQIGNLLENAKTLLLPLLEGLNDALPAIIKGFKELMAGDLAKGIKEAAKTIGSIVGSAISLFMEFPKTFAALGLLLMGPGKWILNGLSLAKGFMMGSRGFGAGGGMGGGMGGAYGVKGGQIGPAGPMSRMDKMAGKGFKGGKFAAGTKGAMGVGMGLGIGSMAMDYGRQQMDNPDSGAGKALGVGSSALQGAAMGMMLGPIGAIVGGVLGAAYGAYTEYGGPSAGIAGQGAVMPPINDGIAMNGKVTPIDSKDDVFKIGKPGGAFDKAANAGPGTKGGGSSGPTNIKISFDTLNVKSDDGSSGIIDLENDSAFMAMLATKIKESLSQTANGGVLSPNPSM